jgi:serine/threonine-protein kinase
VAKRYADDAELIADLEDVLAIETARAGNVSGEVTSVLRTLPRRSRRRLPWRMRHPWRWAASLALLGAIVALVLVLLADHTHSGVAPDVAAKHGQHPVRLSQTAAHDYNPFGTGLEHPTQVSNVVDGDPNTTWSTEHYVEGTLGHKPGVGLYLDADPGVAARAIEIQTAAPGFAAAIYASNDFHRSLPYGDTTPLTQRGWVQLAPARTIDSHTTVPLSNPSNTRYRYYLIWIVKLPQSSEVAEISEATLFS